MKKIFWILFGVFPLSFVYSQESTPTASSSPDAASFKYQSGYSRRCRGAAAASAISH